MCPPPPRERKSLAPAMTRLQHGVIKAKSLENFGLPGSYAPKPETLKQRCRQHLTLAKRSTVGTAVANRAVLTERMKSKITTIEADLILVVEWCLDLHNVILQE